MKTLFLLIAATVSFLASARNTPLFNEANTFYNEGQYQKAIDNYLKILESNEHSAALYYNLGNAYYKLNQVAPSIYYYEKALQLAPGDADIKNNLVFAQNMAIDDIETLPQTGVTSLLKKSIGALPSNTWAILAVACMLVFVAGFILYYLARYRNRKRLFFTASMVALTGAVLSFAFAYYTYHTDKDRRPAIVFEKEIPVKAEPNTRSEEVFLLHEGTKVEVRDALGEWKKIRLSDGKTGWLPAEAVKEVKEF